MPKAYAVGFLIAGSCWPCYWCSSLAPPSRESVLPPGVEFESVRKRRARFSMVIAGVLLTLVISKGKAWWKQVDAEFRSNRLFKPIEAETTVELSDGVQLLKLTDS
jgi:hypothetical protein